MEKKKSNGEGELEEDRLLTEDIRFALRIPQNCHSVLTIMLRFNCPTLKVKCCMAIVSIGQILGSTVPAMLFFVGLGMLSVE